MVREFPSSFYHVFDFLGDRGDFSLSVFCFCFLFRFGFFPGAYGNGLFTGACREDPVKTVFGTSSVEIR